MAEPLSWALHYLRGPTQPSPLTLNNEPRAARQPHTERPRIVRKKVSKSKSKEDALDYHLSVSSGRGWHLNRETPDAAYDIDLGSFARCSCSNVLISVYDARHVAAVGGGIGGELHARGVGAAGAGGIRMNYAENRRLVIVEIKCITMEARLNASYRPTMTPTAAAEINGDLNVFVRKYGAEYISGFGLGHVCTLMVSARSLSAGVEAWLNAKAKPMDAMAGKFALVGLCRALLECEDATVQFSSAGSFKRLSELNEGLTKWIDDFCEKPPQTASLVHIYSTPHPGLECLVPVQAQYKEWEADLLQELTGHKKGCRHYKAAQPYRDEYERVSNWTTRATATTICNSYRKFDPSLILAKLKHPRLSLENRLSIEEKRTSFTDPVPAELLKDILNNACLSKALKKSMCRRLRAVLVREKEYDAAVGYGTLLVPVIGWIITTPIYLSRSEYAANSIKRIDQFVEGRIEKK